MSHYDTLTVAIGDFWLLWDSFDWNQFSRHSWQQVLAYWTKIIQRLHTLMDKSRHWYAWNRRHLGRKPISFEQAILDARWMDQDADFTIEDYYAKLRFRSTAVISRLLLDEIVMRRVQLDNGSDWNSLRLKLLLFLELPPTLTEYNYWLANMTELESIKSATCDDGRELDLDWIFMK